MHLHLATSDSTSLSGCKLKDNLKYSQRLEETLSQMEKRLRHLSDFEVMDLTTGIVQTKRLPVFSVIYTEEEQEETTKDEDSAASAKKPSLNLKSRVFKMPSKKASAVSCDASSGEQGKTTASIIIHQVSDSGKAW